MKGVLHFFVLHSCQGGVEKKKRYILWVFSRTYQYQYSLPSTAIPFCMKIESLATLVIGRKQTRSVKGCVSADKHWKNKNMSALSTYHPWFYQMIRFTKTLKCYELCNIMILTRILTVSTTTKHIKNLISLEGLVQTSFSCSPLRSQRRNTFCVLD